MKANFRVLQIIGQPVKKYKPININAREKVFTRQNKPKTSQAQRTATAAENATLRREVPENFLRADAPTIKNAQAHDNLYRL